MLRGIFAVVLAGSIIATATLKQPVNNSPHTDAFEANMHPPSDVSSMLHRACYDCHSNETRWPWYSRIPPMSWMVHSDVANARNAMNFSEWSTQEGETAQKSAAMLAAACALIEGGQMPKKTYLLLHPDARLSKADQKRFCDWSYTYARELSARSR